MTDILEGLQEVTSSASNSLRQSWVPTAAAGSEYSFGQSQKRV